MSPAPRGGRRPRRATRAAGLAVTVGHGGFVVARVPPRGAADRRRGGLRPARAAGRARGGRGHRGGSRATASCAGTPSRCSRRPHRTGCSAPCPSPARARAAAATSSTSRLARAAGAEGRRWSPSSCAGSPGSSATSWCEPVPGDEDGTALAHAGCASTALPDGALGLRRHRSRDARARRRLPLAGAGRRGGRGRGGGRRPPTGRPSGSASSDFEVDGRRLLAGPPRRARGPASTPCSTGAARRPGDRVARPLRRGRALHRVPRRGRRAAGTRRRGGGRPRRAARARRPTCAACPWVAVRRGGSWTECCERAGRCGCRATSWCSTRHARVRERPVVEEVAALGPGPVVHVACDPASFARDVALLAEAGYALEELRAFDLFPMTHHVEVVAGSRARAGAERDVRFRATSTSCILISR